jgi:hypothetical protein
VKYEASLDLAEGTNRCNCSICSKVRSWFAIVPPKDFKLLQGADALADYQWTPPRSTAPNLHYRFCRSCGVRAFAQGDNEQLGGVFYAIAVATLDDADPDELAKSIRYVDGRHDRFDEPPADTRLL